MPIEVMNILIKNRCEFISAVSSLSDDDCERMLKDAGASGKLLGVRLVLKALPGKINNKGEAYFVQKMKPMLAECSNSSVISKPVNNEHLLTVLKRLVCSYLNEHRMEINEVHLQDRVQDAFTRGDIIASVNIMSPNSICGIIKCIFCQTGKFEIT
jgi:hypothetical protein